VATLDRLEPVALMAFEVVTDEVRRLGIEFFCCSSRARVDYFKCLLVCRH
jgi:hypothetical protein